jgi:poly(A) polymerase Pap1
MGCRLVGADLDLVAALPGAPDMGEVTDQVAAALPGATKVRQVSGARVPGLRFAAGGLDVDLVVVATGEIPAARAVAHRAGLGEAAAIALSAVSDADAVRAAVGDHHGGFSLLARQVKAWARARGLDSAPFGGLPGLAWTVLAARTAVAGPSPAPDPRDLLRHFFATWAAWDWREPVALAPDTIPAAPASGAAVTVMTPSAPVRSCTEQVGPGMRDLLTQELYQAWEALETSTASTAAGAGAWPAALLTPPPLHRRHAAWAVLEVGAVRGEEFEETRGRFRGRVRALLTALEEDGVPDAHAWPRPFATGPDTARYAIGLGQHPPDAARLAGIAGQWARGLPGVGVTRVEGGSVPTLT